MLTPEELFAIVETMHPLLDELNAWITADLIKRLMARLEQGEAFFTAADDWQIQVYQEAGGHLEALQRELARWTKRADKEIQSIFEDAGIKALARDNAFYEARGLEGSPITQSEGMLRLLEDSYQRTAGTVRNFTRTTATASQQRFIKLLDKAHFLVNSGAVSYTRAVEETVKELASEQTKVHYPSGHVDTIETAVLRAVRTGVGQASGNMAIEGMIEHDWDIILVSAHLGARYGDGGENPGNHFWWQGKFYSRTGRTPGLLLFEKATGYGTGEGLCGWNCRHNFGPGDGEFNPYKSYDSEENKRAYDLSQKQRSIEARIRRTKAKLAGLREASMDDEYNKAARLLERQNAAYLDFCRENELRPLMERIHTAKWSREDARRSIMAAKEEKTIAKLPDSGIIEGDERNGGDGVQYITKIDVNKYAAAVEGKIRDSALVLTDNQMEHIINRRGRRFYDKYKPYFATVAEDPDYIFKDKNHPNTAIASKSFSLDGQNVNLVIRLAVDTDDPTLENSLITAILENDKRYAQRLRNNIPLYKKE